MHPSPVPPRGHPSPFTFTFDPTRPHITATATPISSVNGGGTSEFSPSVLVAPPVVVSPTVATLAAATFGTAYSQTFTATGGTGAGFTFALTGMTPPGLMFTGGVLSGTPTALGTSTFTVTATDNGNNTGSQTYTLTVNAVAPVAMNDAYMTAAGMALVVPAATGVLANDTHGSVTVNGDGSFTYTPTAGYVGPDSFTYTLSNGPGTFGTATVTGTVNLTGTGTAPTAVNDAYTATAGAPLVVSATTGVLANDNRGNPAATISGYTQPAHGTANVNGDGSFTYTPTGTYVGPDSFTYTLTNGAGSSTATVNITVAAPTLTALTVTAPPAGTGGNTDTPGNPMLLLGSRLVLTTTGQFSNGTTGPVSPLMYSSSNPGVATVDPVTGLVTALTPGQTTITVTGPGGTRTQITVTVTAAGGGLGPNAQPMLHPTAPTIPNATIAPQPTPHAAGTGGGSGLQPGR